MKPDIRTQKGRKLYQEKERSITRQEEVTVETVGPHPDLQLRMLDEDLAVFEIMQNPVHFSQFFFPPPESKIPLSHYSWSPERSLIIWHWQYPFYLWMVGVFCCGKNIGKSFSIVMRRCWKALWSSGKASVIAAGKEQYSRRLWERIKYWFEFHPILLYWRPTDMTRKGAQNSRHMWFTLKNHWRCQALLSGIGGAGFMGERGYDRTLDETGMLSEEEHAQIRNLLEEPFKPHEWMEDLNFGIPTGDRTSPFYQMDSDDSQYGRYAKFRRKIPSFLHPGIAKDRFNEMLRENQCQFELFGQRVVVHDWGSKGKELMLGQWGEVERPLYPPELYDKNLFPIMTNHYHTWLMTVRDTTPAGFPALMTFLKSWGRRHMVPGLSPLEDSQSKVIVAIDPGKQNCAITVWGRKKTPGEFHYRWWLLGRLMLRGAIDTPTQARIADIVSTHWDADIIVSDTTSQSCYLADSLADAGMFPKANRYYIRDDYTADLNVLREAKASGKQIVLGISSSKPLAIGIDDLGEARTAVSDIPMAYGLSDMLGGLGQLALPGESYDSEFYAAMTSYSEKPKGSSGQRFYPSHSHWVSCAKVFWAAYWLLEMLPIPASDRIRRQSSVGNFVRSTSFLYN